ncbi:unnamed protein product [Polarella glacialis]|uniref:Uncharacterized protein n=1 Tax=Polarella glacialis TaxID=89957 RepID=A0A813ITD9_POLGL|nr:unnamed protein product [Polarella glacialis]
MFSCHLLPGCQDNLSTPLRTVEFAAGLHWLRSTWYISPPVSFLSLPSHDAKPGVNGHDDKQGTEGWELMLLRAKPLTGRVHRIKVQLSIIDRPLVGNLNYGAQSLDPVSGSFSTAAALSCAIWRASFVAESKLPQELKGIFAELQHILQTKPEDKCQ